MCLCVCVCICIYEQKFWFGKKGEYWNKPFGNLLRLYFALKNNDLNLITIFHGVLISAKCSKFS